MSLDQQKAVSTATDSGGRAKPATRQRFTIGDIEVLLTLQFGDLLFCCEGIVGMGESRRQRAGLIAQLATLDPYPESVPINHLVQVEGTPRDDRFHGESALDPLEFVRTIAAARITMPKAMVRLSAGRREFSDAIQALCFLAGANSIFYGDRLLTTGNPDIEADQALFAKLGIAAM
jgi:biotin synthase